LSGLQEPTSFADIRISVVPICFGKVCYRLFALYGGYGGFLDGAPHSCGGVVEKNTAMEFEGVPMSVITLPFNG
jgi:hypothetical protein